METDQIAKGKKMQKYFILIITKSTQRMPVESAPSNSTLRSNMHMYSYILTHFQRDYGLQCKMYNDV